MIKETKTSQFVVELNEEMTVDKLEALLQFAEVEVSSVYTLDDWCDDCEEKADCDNCDERMPDEPRYMP